MVRGRWVDFYLVVLARKKKKGRSSPSYVYDPHPFPEAQPRCVHVLAGAGMVSMFFTWTDDCAVGSESYASSKALVTFSQRRGLDHVWPWYFSLL